MTNILIFGTGGVGTTYAFLLSRSNPSTTITAVCRSNYTAALEHGLSITSLIWGSHTFHPNIASSTLDAQRNGPFDYIVVCSKASVGASPPAAELLRPAVTGGRTAIVLCQNGIGIEAEYAAAYPENPILSGVSYLPVTQTRPGHVVHGELESLEIGTYPASADASPDARAKLTQFADLFAAGGGSVTVQPDIQAQRWIKLVTNAVWNPICALSQCSDAGLLRLVPDSITIVRRAMLEVVAVARAQGYEQITEETAEWQLDRAIGRLKMPRGKEPSMLTDVREGRYGSMEVEPIVGGVVRAAREKGVSTPTLDVVYVLIRGLSVRGVPTE